MAVEEEVEVEVASDMAVALVSMSVVSMET